MKPPKRSEKSKKQVKLILGILRETLGASYFDTADEKRVFELMPEEAQRLFWKGFKREGLTRMEREDLEGAIDTACQQAGLGDEDAQVVRDSLLTKF